MAEYVINKKTGEVHLSSCEKVNSINKSDCLYDDGSFNPVDYTKYRESGETAVPIHICENCLCDDDVKKKVAIIERYIEKFIIIKKTGEVHLISCEKVQNINKSDCLYDNSYFKLTEEKRKSGEIAALPHICEDCLNNDNKEIELELIKSTINLIEHFREKYVVIKKTGEVHSVFCDKVQNIDKSDCLYDTGNFFDYSNYRTSGEITAPLHICEDCLCDNNDVKIIINHRENDIKKYIVIKKTGEVHSTSCERLQNIDKSDCLYDKGNFYSSTYKEYRTNGEIAEPLHICKDCLSNDNEVKENIQFMESFIEKYIIVLKTGEVHLISCEKTKNIDKSDCLYDNSYFNNTSYIEYRTNGKIVEPLHICEDCLNSDDKIKEELNGIEKSIKNLLEGKQKIEEEYQKKLEENNKRIDEIKKDSSDSINNTLTTVNKINNQPVNGFINIGKAIAIICIAFIVIGIISLGAYGLYSSGTYTYSGEYDLSKAKSDATYFVKNRENVTQVFDMNVTDNGNGSWTISGYFYTNPTRSTMTTGFIGRKHSFSLLVTDKGNGKAKISKYKKSEIGWEGIPL